MKKIYEFKNNLFAPLIDDMSQVPKINSNLRQILKIICKNESTDNNLLCASIMELSFNRD